MVGKIPKGEKLIKTAMIPKEIMGKNGCIKDSWLQIIGDVFRINSKLVV